MIKVYPSKKGFIIYIPLLLLLIIMLSYLANGLYLAALLSSLLISAIFFPVFLNTRYILNNDNTLNIKCGFFLNLKIPVADIMKIVPTNSLWSAPALSLDRIEIFYNHFDSVIISPINKMALIADLKNINPAIEY